MRDKIILMSNRIDLSSIDGHWADAVADMLIEKHPEGIITCAAGISPSGAIHFGNFRENATCQMVVKALGAKGREARLVMSFDDYDRFRKVPKNLDESYKEHIGKPLSLVPDINGTYSSYAERYEAQFVKEMNALGIEMEFKYQTEMYKSGVYDEYIQHALENRENIAKILLDNMSDIGKEQKGIVDEEYIQNYYPLSIYSPYSGKDATEVLEYHGGLEVTYRCKITDTTERVDLSKQRIAKLPWKVDWPMRWQYENVHFEPGGVDHASEGSSYTVGEQIVSEIFGGEAPLFVSYGMVGIAGQGGKMSGSKGNSLTPGQLLDIYEKEMVMWIYGRKKPSAQFSLAFDSEIYRQYDEYDKERGINALSFRQTVGLGQAVDFNQEKFKTLLELMEMDIDIERSAERLPLAKNWLEIYNRENMFELRSAPNAEYFNELPEYRQENLRKLRAELISDEPLGLKDLEALSYAVAKNPEHDEKEMKKAQREFFKDVYNMLISQDKGPRLGTFLWALDTGTVIELLHV